MWGRTHIPVANIAGVCSWRKQHLSPLVKLLTTCAALCCCADVSCIDISDSNTGISTVELCIPAQTASTNSNFVHRSVEYICASASWAVHCHCSKVHHTLLVTWHTGFDEYESFLSAFITLLFSMFFMMDLILPLTVHFDTQYQSVTGSCSARYQVINNCQVTAWKMFCLCLHKTSSLGRALLWKLILV